MQNENKEDVAKKLIRSLEEYFKEDHELLYKNNLYEPTFSHRIARYLEKYFDEYHIDCEYSKAISDPKVDENAKRIRPDIIVHTRNTNERNLLIIEVKKCGSKSARFLKDIDKLKKINNLNYNLAAVIGITKNHIYVRFISDELSLGNFNDKIILAFGK